MRIPTRQTPGYSGYTTGRIASVTLPAGGTIQYQYTGGNNGIECADGSTAGLTRTTPDSPSSPWKYARSGSGYQWTTTVTAPLYNGVQDQTVIHFLTNITGANANFYEIERQMYSGSSTLLETVLTCWEGSDSNCSATTGDAGSSWPGLTRVKRTNQFPNSGGISSGYLDTYGSYSFLASHEIHDFASGGAYGSILQTTTNTYSGLQLNETKITDAQSNTISDTQYTWSIAVTPTTGTPQRASSYSASGNITSVKRWVSGSTHPTASNSLL